MSNEFPGHADAAVLGITLGESPLRVSGPKPYLFMGTVRFKEIK